MKNKKPIKKNKKTVKTWVREDKKKLKTIKVWVMETHYRQIDVPENFLKLTSDKMKK